METYIAALDQGTTTSRAILFNSRGEIVSQAQYPFRADLSPARLGGARPHGDLGHATAGRCPRRWTPPISTPRPLPASASPTSGRRPSSGTGAPASRYTTPLCGSAAGRRDICDRLKAEGAGETGDGKDRPADRRLLFRHEAQMDAWTTSPASGSGRSGESCAPARWTAGSSGTSPAARPM